MPLSRLLTSLSFLATLVFAIPSQAESPIERPDLPKAVDHVLRTHCYGCHGPEKQKAKIRFDTLASDFVRDRRAAETWHDALDAVAAGEMPPEDEPELNAEERAALTGWIRGKLDEAIAAMQGKSEGVVLRRLNKAEYRYTLGDLLGLPGNYGEKLPEDSLSDDGFANNGAALGMSALQLEYYLETAREALGRVLVEGEQPERTVQTATESAAIKGVAPGIPGLRLGRANYFALRVENVPRSGDFTVRVTARVDSPNARTAFLGAEYGNKISGAISLLKPVGTADVASAEARVYAFRGRAEDFPMIPREGEKYLQLLVLKNVLDDGEPLPEPKKNAKGKETKEYPEDPDFPKIVVESAEFVSHDYAQWPPERHRRIMVSQDPREVLRNFLAKAWRKPATEAELDRVFAHFQAVAAQTDSQVAAIRETLAAALASSNFLYLVEPHLKTGESRPLDAYELASRISYFLWSSMPDARLFELAASGELLQPATLRSEVTRMLADAKSERFIEQFTTQWLDLGGLERVAVNPQFYPDFDDALKADMIGETRAFFAEILRSGHSALEFLDADWTMANAALTKHYGGLTGPKSQKFERVSLKGANRPGGLLGHASMHLANSDGEDSHPINRAIWIRERLLHDPPLPPPPNVPALDSTDPDFAKLPIREQLKIHRADPACADCHNGIDPWGIALDHFDAVGLWRDEIRRPSGKRGKFDRIPVDARDTLPGGVKLDGVESLQAYLLEERRDQFAHALVSKLLTYALGRSLELGDEPALDALTDDFAQDGYRLPGLIQAIATSEPFLTR